MPTAKKKIASQVVRIPTDAYRRAENARGKVLPRGAQAQIGTVLAIALDLGLEAIEKGHYSGAVEVSL